MSTLDNDKLKKIFGNVAETMLITLYARAVETETRNPIVEDWKAVEIVKRLKEHNPEIVAKFNKTPNFKKLAAFISMRARRFDHFVRNFVKKNPNGMVVNMGCGLDTRYERLNLQHKKETEWFDLDLSEVIDIKKLFFQETEQYHLIGASVAESKWMAPIAEKKRPVLFIAEGLFMYLTEGVVKSLVLRLQENFPGCELACEVSHSMIVRRMQRGIKRKFKKELCIRDVTYKFGMKNARHFEKWNSDIQLLEEWTCFDDREKKLGWMRLLGFIPVARKSQWVVYYKLNAPTTNI